MKKVSLIVGLVSIVSSSLVWGFVPPLTAVLKIGFEGRKAGSTETTFRHQITLKSGETITVDEQIAEIDGRTYIIFKSATFGDVAGTWNRGAYSFSGDKKISSRSSIWNRYWLTANGEDFREQLIQEKFLKRDQLLQLKPAFTPKGDPATWDLKENYIIQPQVYFARTPSGVSIVAVGQEDATSRKAVFFDKASLVLSRLEWKDGEQTTAWNFTNFKKMPGDGMFPSEFSFLFENKEVIKSILVSRRPLKDKTKSQWMSLYNAQAKNSLAPTLEEGLRLLLGYR
ncbi:MAG: hypothetical protein EB078_08125 [Proteobacteria bacterium]|nr:hypothetical protein [Pseudomonadota bacterium]NDC23613.1 hypothetical protein [Pseudomonadota bacterium]NDD04857.1 hypothetical protein [Pseudomonadota bacterium]